MYVFHRGEGKFSVRAYLKDAACLRFFKSGTHKIGMDILGEVLLEYDTHRFSYDSGDLLIDGRLTGPRIACRLILRCSKSGRELRLKMRSVFIFDPRPAIREVCSCFLALCLQLRRKRCSNFCLGLFGHLYTLREL